MTTCLPDEQSLAGSLIDRVDKRNIKYPNEKLLINSCDSVVKQHISKRNGFHMYCIRSFSVFGCNKYKFCYALSFSDTNFPSSCLFLNIRNSKKKKPGAVVRKQRLRTMTRTVPATLGMVFLVTLAKEVERKKQRSVRAIKKEIRRLLVNANDLTAL